MWTVMDAAAREEFLAGVHVGVLSAAMGAPGRTLAVPVWYGYRPSGLVTVLTGRGSRKARAIRAAGRFSLCAQDERPPYRYVSVEGPVLSEDEPSAAERLALAHRYLGPADGDRYVADNPDPGGENVAFRMRPEHWLSQDQGTELAARLPARTARRACETGQPVTLLLRIGDYELVTTVSLQLVDARITTGSGRPLIVLSGRRPGGLATGRAGECVGEAPAMPSVRSQPGSLETAAAATCASGRQTALPRAEHPVPVSMTERDDVDAPSVLAGPRRPIQDCAFPRVIATATRLARLREAMPLSKAIAGIGVRCEPQSGGGA